MNRKLLYFIAVMLAVLVGGYVLSHAFAEENQATASNDVFYDYAPQRVNALPIPDEVQFAGVTVDLTRHDLRERMDRELLAFTYMHSTTFLLIKRANLYFPIIEPILKEQGIPDDFKYLAVIESYLNPRAVSPVKAVGVWQFVVETAKECGLEVNEQVDERRHLEKATMGACRYLQQSYDVYGDWLTAGASYNAGRRRITSSLEEQKADDCLELYLNEETSRYVFRLMAVKEILSRPKDFGFHLEKSDFYHTVRTSQVEVNTSVADWAEWAEEHGMNYVQLKYFNPWIASLKLDNPYKKTYTVKIPYAEDLNFDVKKVKIHNKAWVE